MWQARGPDEPRAGRPAVGRPLVRCRSCCFCRAARPIHSSRSICPRLQSLPPCCNGCQRLAPRSSQCSVTSRSASTRVPLNMDNPANVFEYLSRRHVDQLHGERRADRVVRRPHVERAAAELTRRSARSTAATLAGRTRGGPRSAGGDRRCMKWAPRFRRSRCSPKNYARSARTDKGLALYAADLDLLDRQMTLYTSALARLRSRASVSSPREKPRRVGSAGFGEQWQLRHPQAKLERFCGAECRHLGRRHDGTVGQIPDDPARQRRAR